MFLQVLFANITEFDNQNVFSKLYYNIISKDVKFNHKLFILGNVKLNTFL